MCLAGFGNSVLLGLEEGEHRIESVLGDYWEEGGIPEVYNEGRRYIQIVQ